MAFWSLAWRSASVALAITSSLACALDTEDRSTLRGRGQNAAPGGNDGASGSRSGSGSGSGSGGTTPEAPPVVEEGPGDGGASDGGAAAGSGGGGAQPSGTFDMFQQRNLTAINGYRATKGLAPLVLDAQLSAFALAGSKLLSQDHQPHHNFILASSGGKIFTVGFRGSAAENQGDPNGWTKLAADPTQNELLQVDSIQKAMFDEGPGTGTAHGHYNNIMNPRFKKVGVGLLMVGSSLYLTNDFSE